MKRRIRATAGLAAWYVVASVAAQPVYRCDLNGKATYSHEPCMGAKVVDTTPTQGLDKSSGVSRKGADVQRDEFNKAIAEALRPLVNETPQERALRHRRAKLPYAAQQECAKLDGQIAGVPAKPQPEEETLLFSRRKRFRELDC